LNLIVANQFTTQLSDEIRDAVFGNVGSIVSFRVGTNDAEFLAKQFSPVFDADDLQRIPNANTIVRMLIGGVPAQPFSMATMPPLGTPNKQLGDALRQLSAAKYGRPKAVVEKEIFDRLRTSEPARPAFGASPFAAPGASPQAAPASAMPKQPSSSGSSFLDEWLAKRRSPTASSPVTPTAFRGGPANRNAAPSAPVAATNPFAGSPSTQNQVSSQPPQAPVTPNYQPLQGNVGATYSATRPQAAITPEIGKDRQEQGVVSSVPPSAVPQKHEGEIHLNKPAQASTDTEDVLHINRSAPTKTDS
jgi:hypothetical protein